MKIKIKSIECNDLPEHYFRDSSYRRDMSLENFRVGDEYDVYGIAFSNVHHYFIRIDPDSLYLSAYPAALTEVIDRTMPSSWVVSHETKAQHRKLPDHQVVVCPVDWVSPFFSMFIDRLDDGCEKEVQIFLSTTQRDYPSLSQ
jgi:hypothetical protein